MKKKYISIHILFLIIYMCTYMSVSAETMTGTTYILNGSINPITGQNQSVTQSIQSSGNPIQQQSSGSVYTLYSTGYIQDQPPVTTSDTQSRTGQTLSGVVFGDRSDASLIPSVLFSKPTGDVQDVQKKVDIVEEYTQYQYTTDDGVDSVQFGKKNTSVYTEEGVRVPVNWSLVWIIILGGLLIGLEIWKRYHKNKI